MISSPNKTLKRYCETWLLLARTKTKVCGSSLDSSDGIVEKKNDFRLCANAELTLHEGSDLTHGRQHSMGHAHMHGVNLCFDVLFRAAGRRHGELRRRMSNDNRKLEARNKTTRGKTSADRIPVYQCSPILVYDSYSRLYPVFDCAAL